MTRTLSADRDAVSPDLTERRLGRPREFEEDEVLDAAIECFWRRGLEATSLRDLSAATGLNQPSLHNAFGGKRSLFVTALERYATRTMRERIERLERRHRPTEAVRTFFRELIARSLSDPDRRGCLIVNSALEVAPHDAGLQVVIASYLGEIEGFFLRCLQRAKDAGEVPATFDVRDGSRLFLGILLGLRVAARAKPDRALLEGMVRPALSLLDNSGSPAKVSH